MTVEVALGVGVVVGAVVCVSVGARVWLDVAEGVSEAIWIGISVGELQADSSMASMNNKQE